MADHMEDNLVCDPKFIMRSRLFCGMYNRRSVHPRLRGLAKAYCLMLAIITIYVYYLQASWDILRLLNGVPQVAQYLLALVTSLWTEDEYIYKFFIRNRITDVTLDSPIVFNRLQKQITTGYVMTSLLYFVYLVLAIVISSESIVLSVWIRYISTMTLAFFVTNSQATKLLVMALFNSRILVLRRRLERYGFRTIGRVPPQPYCQIYDEIWQGVYATDNPLKLLLLFDLINCSCEFISLFTYYIFTFSWQELTMVRIFVSIISTSVTLFLRLVFSFGHVALLESSVIHCDAMAVFTATQLVKTPNAEERQRMYALLRALEQRGARYRVLRALPLDAKLVLRVLAFCSSQALVLIDIIKAK